MTDSVTTSVRLNNCSKSSAYGRLYSRSRIKLQLMLSCRDEDFAKFNERETDMKLVQSQHQQMKIRLESMEKIQEESEENSRQEL